MNKEKLISKIQEEIKRELRFSMVDDGEYRLKEVVAAFKEVTDDLEQDRISMNKTIRSERRFLKILNDVNDSENSRQSMIETSETRIAALIKEREEIKNHLKWLGDSKNQYKFLKNGEYQLTL